MLILLTVVDELMYWFFGVLSNKNWFLLLLVVGCTFKLEGDTKLDVTFTALFLPLWACNEIGWLELSSLKKVFLFALIFALFCLGLLVWLLLALLLPKLLKLLLWFSFIYYCIKLLLTSSPLPPFITCSSRSIQSGLAL